MKNILEIIAGPNGSGKTTFAESIFSARKNNFYVNADAIAAGLTLNGSKEANFEAGRFMLRSINTAIQERKSLAFETTFSGRIWTHFLKRAKKNGFKIIIYFVFVKSIPLSLERIKQRVKKGGHDVPPSIVRRRFKKTFKNFWFNYKQYADEWSIVDNSREPVCIARLKNKKFQILNKFVFHKFFNP